MSIPTHQMDALLFGVGAYASEAKIPKTDTQRLLVLIRAAMPVLVSDPEMAQSTLQARQVIRGQVETYRATIVAMVLDQKISIEMGAELEGLTEAIMREVPDGT